MKRTILLFFAALAIVGSSKAQITLGQSDFATIGTSLTYNVDSVSNGLTVGGSGNTAWDFTTIQVDFTESETYVDPSSTTNANDFTSSNLAVEMSAQTTYLSTSAAAIEVDGIVADIVGTGIMSLVYNPSERYMTLPATYLDTDSDIGGYQITYNGLGVTNGMVDSIRVHHQNNKNSEIDAYGDLIAPNGTYTTLRQYTLINTSDSLWIYVTDPSTAMFLGISVNTWSFAPVISGVIDSNPVLETIYNYRWYATGENNYLLEAIADAQDGNILNMRYQDQLGAAPACAGFNAEIWWAQNDDCGTGNGYIDGGANGGTGPYTYAWNTGATTTWIDGLSAGTYTFSITDAAGCIDDTIVTITSGPAFAVSISTTEDICNDGSGTATATVYGGTAPYYYQWSNGESAASASNLEANWHYLQLYDDNGCWIYEDFEVLGGLEMIINLSSEDATCGQLDGAVSITVTDGNPPYSYEWETQSGAPLGTTQNLTNLGPGVVFVTITDDEGCTMWEAEIVDNIGAPNITITTSEITCGGSDGELTVEVLSSGTAPFTFQWGNLDGTISYGTSETITGLSEGVYIATVTDANGCIAFEGLYLEGSGVETEIEIDQVNMCAGASDGAVYVNYWGGTSPYTYDWSTGATNAYIWSLASGTYSVTVTDGSGCTSVSTVDLDPVDPIQIDITTTDGTCGSSTGTATATASSGTAPYYYYWETGDFITVISGLAVGTYTVTVYDDYGCENASTAIVGATDGPQVDNVTITNVNCSGGSDGTATVSAVGGTAPYTFSWDNGSTSEDATALSAGMYNVVITDNTGCIGGGFVDIVEPTSISGTTSSTEADIATANGTATVTASGGTPPYTYSWSGGQTDVTATGLLAGDVDVVITDANGCAKTLTATVEQASGIIQLIENLNVTIYPNPNNGEFTVLLPTNKEEKLSISIVNIMGKVMLAEEFNGETSQLNYDLSHLSSGVYFFTITDYHNNMTQKIIIR